MINEYISIIIYNNLFNIQNKIYSIEHENADNFALIKFKNGNSIVFNNYFINSSNIKDCLKKIYIAIYFNLKNEI